MAKIIILTICLLSVGGLFAQNSAPENQCMDVTLYQSSAPIFLSGAAYEKKFYTLFSRREGELDKAEHSYKKIIDLAQYYLDTFAFKEYFNRYTNIDDVNAANRILRIFSNTRVNNDNFNHTSAHDALPLWNELQAKREEYTHTCSVMELIRQIACMQASKKNDMQNNFNIKHIQKALQNQRGDFNDDRSKTSSTYNGYKAAR